MAERFTFGGKTITAPGILVDTSIGSSRLFELLPLGTIAMFGTADGGSGDGAVYKFQDINVAKRLLRGGPLLKALERAANIGGATGFVACVLGHKTPATLTLGAATSAPGIKTVTPASMSGIIVGEHLVIDSAGTYESVAVTAATNSTFTATFTLPHLATAKVESNPGGLSAGTILEAVTAPGIATVTPSTMSYLAIGNQIDVDAGTNKETVIITGVTATTITATFTKAHAAGVAFARTPISTTLGTAVAAVGGTAVITAGDQGAWTNGIGLEIIAGTTVNKFAAVFAYVDPTSGRTIYLGGLKTAFDNLVMFSDLAKAVLTDNLLTPPPSSGLPAIVSISVAVDGPLSLQGFTNLTGGTGSGAQSITFLDVKTGIDSALTTPFDIGHLVGVYDAASQSYADAQAVLVSGYGNLRRFIHQAKSATASASLDKVSNSLAIVNAGAAAANAINSIRSSVCPQRIAYNDPDTGTTNFVDVAPFICGMAALVGATGEQGPATPLTFETIPGARGVEFEVLDTTGDRDFAVTQGVIVLDQVGSGNAARVRIVQSVTTAPLDGNGNPWIFGEFSVVRVSDAVLANVKAVVESNRPKVVGGGNTRATMQSVLADVHDVLEDALGDSWITEFDPASITIFTTGSTGTSDIVRYDMAPTLPLNHLGIGQNLLPFSASLALGGAVNG